MDQARRPWIQTKEILDPGLTRDLDPPGSPWVLVFTRSLSFCRVEQSLCLWSLESTGENQCEFLGSEHCMQSFEHVTLQLASF